MWLSNERYNQIEWINNYKKCIKEQKKRITICANLDVLAIPCECPLWNVSRIRTLEMVTYPLFLSDAWLYGTILYWYLVTMLFVIILAIIKNKATPHLLNSSDNIDATSYIPCSIDYHYIYNLGDENKHYVM